MFETHETPGIGLNAYIGAEDGPKVRFYHDRIFFGEVSMGIYQATGAKYVFRDKTYIPRLLIGGITDHNDISDPEVKLSVNGKIYAEGIKCQLAGNWADYVFSSNYELKSLVEVENFIKNNKHLPGIPSEKEVKENGIDLTEMMTLQMEKIEELTLYIIELEKKINQMKSSK